MVRQKQTIEYTSSLDTLVSVAKRLNRYKTQAWMESEESFNHYSQGQLGDDALFIEWANYYRHYLALLQDLAAHLSHAG